MRLVDSLGKIVPLPTKNASIKVGLMSSSQSSKRHSWNNLLSYFKTPTVLVFHVVVDYFSTVLYQHTWEDNQEDFQ